MTLSPTARSSGTRLPLSSMRPGPIARTSPSWGFSLAVSGITRPEAVVCSASLDLTTMRSSSGLMDTDTVGPPLRECRGLTGRNAGCDWCAGRRRGVDLLTARVGTCTGRVLGQNLGRRLALGQLECQKSACLSGPDCSRRRCRPALMGEDVRHGPSRGEEADLRRGLGPAAVTPP